MSPRLWSSSLKTRLTTFSMSGSNRAKNSSFVITGEHKNRVYKDATSEPAFKGRFTVGATAKDTRAKGAVKSGKDPILLAGERGTYLFHDGGEKIIETPSLAGVLLTATCSTPRS